MISKNFSESEWVCHCGCGQMIIVQNLVDKMQTFRDLVKKRCVVHCVNRCPAHNQKLIDEGVNASKSSRHLTGEACDFHIPGISIKELHAIVLNSDDIFDGGIGLYDWGVHIDVGPKRFWDSRKETL